MTFDQIIQLVNAGYTKADIDAMTQASGAGGSAAGSEPSPAAADPAPVEAQPAEQPETKPVNQTPEQPEADRFKQLEDKLNKLLGITQAANVNANIGGSAQPSRSATDILGSVIAPPRKESGK